MNIETAQTTRLGDRESNQDRACLVVSDADMLLAVADGMGGHADGEAAAECAIASFIKGFKQERPDAASAAVFLSDQVRQAHRAVVKLGSGRSFEHRPRTTITACVITERSARWVHVGDSRVYVFREGRLLARTRDHSAVEMLYQQGLISEEEMHTHPMRNYVDQCLGGEATAPDMDLSDALPLAPGDVVLLCSDGFWSPLDTEALGEILHEAEDLQDTLDEIAAEAETATKPYSDNVTAVAVRWLADD